MGKITERLKNGIIDENPTFVQMLGMCPTLAVTTSAINGAGMGLATTVILTLSNLFISLLRKVIPDKVRIPAFIVIIASFVTIVQFVMQAFVPSLYASLGLFIPLIVVNCIILGRAEAYASKNQVIPSIFDGIGMGLGFTVGLTTIGIVREFFGSGSFFGIDLFGKINTLIDENASEKVVEILHKQGIMEPTSIFVFAPGAFFVLAFLIAFLNHRNIKKAKKAGVKPELCTLADCASCQNTACHGARKVEETKTSAIVEKKEEKEVKPEKAVNKEVKEVKPESADNKEEKTEKATEPEQAKKNDTQSSNNKSAGNNGNRTSKNKKKSRNHRNNNGAKASNNGKGE